MTIADDRSPLSRRTIPIAALVLLLSTVPALATTGRVAQPGGAPIENAKVCIMVSGREGLCVLTNERGEYSFPTPQGNTIRVTADGWLPKRVAAVDQESPIVLERAASLRIRLLDQATDEPIAKGHVLVTATSGKKSGPFPVNAKGVWIRTVRPGEVVLKATAEGYADQVEPAMRLAAGDAREVVIRMHKGAGSEAAAAEKRKPAAAPRPPPKPERAPKPSGSPTG